MSARQRFLDAVRSPPTDVVAVRQRLLSRAERLAETVPRAAVPPAVDVVVAGSGFLSVYYLGVHSVLSRLTDCKRFAGASSGAQAPFQLLLAGEAATLDSYLCHGLLFGRQWLGPAMFSADQNWKALSAELVSRHAHELPKLDGRCVVSVTRWTRGGPRNVLYTEWSGQQQLATEAFYATGTALTRCGGYWCSDGGMTNNEPVFADAPERAQLVVRPTRSGLPMRMVVGYTLEQCVEAFERGQDDAVRLFERDGSGAPAPRALEWLRAPRGETGMG